LRPIFRGLLLRAMTGRSKHGEALDRGAHAVLKFRRTIPLPKKRQARNAIVQDFLERSLSRLPSGAPEKRPESKNNCLSPPLAPAAK
jgi:hypothetical protein